MLRDAAVDGQLCDVGPVQLRRAKCTKWSDWGKVGRKARQHLGQVSKRSVRGSYRRKANAQSIVLLQCAGVWHWNAEDSGNYYATEPGMTWCASSRSVMCVLHLHAQIGELRNMRSPAEVVRYLILPTGCLGRSCVIS